LRYTLIVYLFRNVIFFWGPVWLALVAGSIALTALATTNDTLPGDLDLLRRIQDFPVPGLSLSRFIRLITATQVVLGLGAVLAVVLWLLRRRRLAFLLALGLIILPFLQTGLKEIVDRPRPPADLVDIRAGFSSDSFPAGHVMSGAFFYGFLFYLSLLELRPGVMRTAFLVLSAAVLALAGWVNVYVGVHWPSDVVGGYGWGFVLLLPLLCLDATVREVQDLLLYTLGMRRL
jgi:membrane-associated phospholipid phosphatase